MELTPDHVPDINVITGVLKDYLRELPEPLFTRCLFQMTVDALGMDSNSGFNREEKIFILRSFCSRLLAGRPRRKRQTNAQHPGLLTTCQQSKRPPPNIVVGFIAYKSLTFSLCRRPWYFCWTIYRWSCRRPSAIRCLHKLWPLSWAHR